MNIFNHRSQYFTNKNKSLSKMICFNSDSINRIYHNIAIYILTICNKRSIPKLKINYSIENHSKSVQTDVYNHDIFYIELDDARSHLDLDIESYNNLSNPQGVSESETMNIEFVNRGAIINDNIKEVSIRGVIPRWYGGHRES